MKRKSMTTVNPVTTNQPTTNVAFKGGKNKITKEALKTVEEIGFEIPRKMRLAKRPLEEIKETLIAEVGVKSVKEWANNTTLKALKETAAKNGYKDIASKL